MTKNELLLETLKVLIANNVNGTYYMDINNLIMTITNLEEK